jgi:hypothetical protein
MEHDETSTERGGYNDPAPEDEAPQGAGGAAGAGEAQGAGDPDHEEPRIPIAADDAGASANAPGVPDEDIPSAVEVEDSPLGAGAGEDDGPDAMPGIVPEGEEPPADA